MQYVGRVDSEAPEARDTTQRARDAALLLALQRGDERAFLGFVRSHHAALVRVALGYVRRPAIAE
jgi:hypothetical protein